MFIAASEVYSIDVSGWDTSNVTNMYSMFSDGYVRSIIGIESWDTSNVIYMNEMFSYAYAGLELDLSSWNVCNVTTYSTFSSYQDEEPNPYVTSPYFGDSTKCNGGNSA